MLRCIGGSGPSALGWSGCCLGSARLGHGEGRSRESAVVRRVRWRRRSSCKRAKGAAVLWSGRCRERVLLRSGEGATHEGAQRAVHDGLLQRRCAAGARGTATREGAVRFDGLECSGQCRERVLLESGGATHEGARVAATRRAAAAERRLWTLRGGLAGRRLGRPTGVTGSTLSRSGPETNEMIANAIRTSSRANGDAGEVSALTVSTSMAQRTESVCEYATDA